MVVKVAATRTVHIHTVNPKTVSAVKRRMRPSETMVRLADTFSALGDPARAKILYVLAQEELCVCDLAEVVGVTESGGLPSTSCPARAGAGEVPARRARRLLLACR